MKVSLDIVQNLTGFDLPPIDELVERVNSQLGGVEEIIDLGVKYKDAKIVRVVECEKHPNADKLTVCQVDVGQDELVQVVCGAPNSKADMWAVWLPPESVVPSTFDDKEPFKLGARELRGVMSHGMLAAGDELDINDDHEGIIEIVQSDLPEGASLVAGSSFAEVFGLSGYIIDIENKMFTHRPDLFGQLGVAREVAGIFGKKFESPSWYGDLPTFSTEPGFGLGVFNEAGSNVPRLMFASMKDIAVGPSPLWLQSALVAMGSRSINNIVDITNYIMLMTAQPVHAYDYDKLRGAKIGARMAKLGEEVRLLNDKVYSLDEGDIVIADAEGPIGLAGIMGGSDTEVDESTKNIVLEVATFDMYTVRRSSMRHGLFTDALTRFNKGQSPLQNGRVLSRLIDSVMGVNSSAQVCGLFDFVNGESVEVSGNLGLFDKANLEKQIKITPEFINDRLGSDMTASEMVELLSNVEFEVSESDGTIDLKSPFWRTDIELLEDVVEEVGRLYGFDKLPRELPTRTTSPAEINLSRATKQKIRNSLSRLGANELLTYSFVHENIIKKAEQDASQAFRLGNALSPDLQYYRLTVLPSLLDKVHMNIKAGHDEFMLFEIGKGHNKKYHADDDEGLPKELQFVDMVYASKKPKDGAPYYRMKRYLEQLFEDHGIGLTFKSIVENMDYPVTAPFDLSRSALVEANDGTFIGMIGELKQSVIRNFKLPNYVSAATLDFEGVKRCFSVQSKGYQPLSRYPSVSQDISLRVSSSVGYGQLVELVNDHLRGLKSDILFNIQPLSVYQADDDNAKKTITTRIRFTSHDKTLSDKEAGKFMDEIAEAAHKEFGAERI